MIWKSITASILFIVSQFGIGDNKLLFLQTIFRHGDRAPLSQYPFDPVSPDFWPEGYGMLTKLGKQQHFSLGKYLRQLYKDFITSNPIEVFVNSTDIQRCIESAQCHLASLYAPTPEYAFDDELHWQPIPIHYTDWKKDKYLSFDSYCPRALQEEKNIYRSAEYFKLNEKYKPILRSLSNYVGYFPNPRELREILDAWFVHKKYNITLPQWAEFHNTKLYYSWSNFIFAVMDSPVLQRLRAGPIIGKIIENMNEKIAGKIPNLKVQVYSSQYHHLLAIMKALKVFNSLDLPYCATLIFELHELLKGSKAVRLLFLNSTVPEFGYQEPHALTLEGCFEYCPLEYFINYTKELIPQDWEKECRLTN